MGSADTEAQKALARGLKNEIANAVPEVSGLNKQLSEYIKASDVIGRRALMQQNNNPMGLGLLTPSKAQLLAFLADRSAGAKALAARGMYSAAPDAGRVGGLLSEDALLPIYRAAGLLSLEASP